MGVGGEPLTPMSGIATRLPSLTRQERVWLRYLVADLEGDTERMRRAGHVLDVLRSRS
jgi:hypothetical protein